MGVNYIQLAPHHFDAVIALGNEVHGDNYLDMSQIKDIYERSWSNGTTASWVAVIPALLPQSKIDTMGAQQNACKQTPDGYLVGFRLTIAATNWKPDKWCTPNQWGHRTDQVCYFKCNTVDSTMRGQGVGSTLLRKSIESAKAQNAVAGVAHIWMQSPNNSAFEYFKASGGHLVKEHPNKWQIHTIEDGYECPVCESLCYCVASEMIIHFDHKGL
jgi:ribosomal protein S18 acetylase RimI-like enzyme